MKLTNQIRPALIIFITLFSMNASSQKWQKLDDKYEAHYQSGNYYKAVEFSLKEIDQAIIEFDSLHYNYILSLNNCAKAYLAIEELDKSYFYINKAIVVYLNNNDIDVTYAYLLDVLGHIFMIRNEYQKADSTLNKSLLIKKTELGAYNMECAYTLENLARNMLYQGKYEKAKEYYLETIIIIEQNEEISEFSATVYSSLGVNYQNEGDYDNAINMFFKGIALFEESGTHKAEDYGVTLNALGLTYLYLNQFDKSEEYLLEAEKFHFNEPGNYYNLVNNLALLYKATYKYNKADIYYEKLIKLSKENMGENPNNYSTILANIGQYYYQKGNFKKGEELILESLEIKRDILPADDYQLGEAIYMLGEFYYYQSQFEKANLLVIEALDILGKQLPYDNIKIINCINALAFINLDLELFDKSLELFKLNLSNLTKDEYPVYYLYTLSGLVRNYYFLADLDSAIHYLDIFFFEAIDLDLIQDPVVSATLAYASILYSDLSEFEKSTLYANESVKRVKNQYGKDHPEYAIRLNILGLIYYKQQNYLKAKTLFLEAKRIIESGQFDNYPGASNVYNNLSLVFRRFGRTQDAIMNLEKALSYSDRSGTKINLADLYFSIGNTDHAYDLLLQAKEQIIQNYGENHPNYANVLIQIEYINIRQDNFGSSLKNIILAENIYKETFGPNCTQLLDCYLLYAEYFEKLGEVEKEYEYRKTILKFNQTNFGKENPESISSLIQYAFWHENVGNRDSLQFYIKEAMDLVMKSHGKKSQLYHDIIGEVAYSFYDAGLFEQSELYFSEIIYYEQFEHLKTLGILSSDERINYLTNLYNYKYYNNFLARFPLNQRIVCNAIDNRLFYKGLLSDADKDFERQLRQTNDTILMNQHKMLKTVRDEIAQMVSLPFEEQISFVHRIDSLRNVESIFETTLSRKLDITIEYNPLSWKSIRKSLNKNEACVEIIKLIHKNYEKQFQFFGYGFTYDTTAIYPVIYSVYPSSPIEKAGLVINDKILEINGIDLKNKNTSEIREILTCFPEGATIKYIREGKTNISPTPVYCDSVFLEKTYDFLYIALIITSKTTKQPEVVILNNGYNLENNIYNSYIKSIYSTKSDPIIDSLIYEAYWSKIEKKLSDIKTIYLSPDGVYNKINIETLIKTGTQYVTDIHDIILVNSLREVLDISSSIDTGKNNAVLVGNPTFDIDLSQSIIESADYLPINKSIKGFSPERNISGFSLNNLPGTQYEIDSIEQLLNSNNWNCKVLSKESALEENVKQIRNPRVLHIATHGYFKEITQHINIEDDNMALKAYYSIDLDPLLGSCLFLTGAQRALNNLYDYNASFDDGILTAYEILNMNLDSTQLVILSACETGLGELKDGQGVYGLQRAFHIAGAKQLIMSLWKVDDHVTQILMTEFYNRWLSGLSVKESLRLAQDHVRSYPQYSRPFYWGAFVVSGLEQVFNE